MELNLGCRNESTNALNHSHETALNNLSNLSVNRLALLYDILVLEILPSSHTSGLNLRNGCTVLTAEGYNNNLDFIANLNNIACLLRLWIC